MKKHEIFVPQKLPAIPYVEMNIVKYTYTCTSNFVAQRVPKV